MTVPILSSLDKEDWITGCTLCGAPDREVMPIGLNGRGALYLQPTLLTQPQRGICKFFPDNLFNIAQVPSKGTT
jgi:hypothetical protein